MQIVSEVGAGPRPHPAAQAENPRWVAGWGRGLVPFLDND